MWRKFRSALRIVLQSKHPLDGLRDALARRRAARQIRAHDGRPFVYDTPGNNRWVCVPESDTSVLVFTQRGRVEEAETAVCQAWLEPGDACLDVGANIGFFTAMFAA